ncbi:Uncharacterized protein Adt_44485 [Abeliophyllum distichum]|uniref:AP2/ERF domain-containing protein n=1 Tax=Abeliophyllum distichum TaxID=126358 RepID=A0ABD1PB16_9LAMI
MATSAFKSTSRRGGAESKAPQSTANKRRSHSVSAVSRAAPGRQLDRSSSISSEFSYKRDNPLFWSGSSPPDNEIEIDKGKNGITGEVPSISNKFPSPSSSAGNGINNEQRGRTVTRNSHGSGGVKNGIGRSLSRVRGRSVSRGHYGGRVYESEKSQDMDTWTDARNRNVKKQIGNNVKKTNLVRSEAVTRGHVKNPQLTMIQNQATDWSEDDSACSLQIPNVDDGISTGYLSEAEEKMVMAVPEQMKAFQANNTSTITATNVAGMPPDLVNPGDIELIFDIRREYASKLEESEERARKLRADLASEEHRGQELGRILKEIIPEPKTSSAQRSRRGRRTSSERKRMSKRLTDEALAYFDECVSLSTFDSSDFSASEDPSYTSVGVIPPIADVLSLQKSSLCPLSSKDHGSGLHQKQLLHCSENSALTSHSSSDEPRSSQEYRFSFAHKQLENAGTHQDIKSYIEHFRRETHKDIDSESAESYYDAGEYNLQGHIESVLFDRLPSNPSLVRLIEGAYDNEESAARTYDLAALKYWGPTTPLNFPLEIGVSKYRGVARHHHNGRWEARIGRVSGNKYLYLGTYSTQEEAAAAYDMAAIEFRGPNAVTNFDISNYTDKLKKITEEVGVKQEDDVQVMNQETPEDTTTTDQEEYNQMVQPSVPKLELTDSIDSEVMAMMDPPENIEHPWDDICLDIGFNSLQIPNIPLDKPNELLGLFDEKGFEDDIDFIFDNSFNENEFLQDAMSGTTAGCKDVDGDILVGRDEKGMDASLTTCSPSTTTSVGSNI